MNTTNKISKYSLLTIIGLVVSVFWIFMGLDFNFPFGAPDLVCSILTLGGYRHTVMTIIALILIPLCAREFKWAFIVSMVLGIVIVTLSSVHVIYMLIATPTGYQSQLFGPIAWSVIQIPVIIFSFKARKEMIDIKYQETS